MIFSLTAIVNFIAVGLGPHSENSLEMGDMSEYHHDLVVSDKAMQRIYRNTHPNKGRRCMTLEKYGLLVKYNPYSSVKFSESTI